MLHRRVQAWRVWHLCRRGWAGLLEGRGPSSLLIHVACLLMNSLWEVRWRLRHSYSAGSHTATRFSRRPHWFLVRLRPHCVLRSTWWAEWWDHQWHRAVKYPGHSAFLSTFAVAEEHRGKGYGRKIGDAAFNDLNKQNVTIGMDAVTHLVPNMRLMDFAPCGILL